MIWYIVDARIPTEKAHGWQIVTMVKELSNFDQTVLVVPDRKNSIQENIKNYYGLSKEIKTKVIKILDFFGLINNPKMAFYLNRLQFLLKVIFLPIKKNNIILTRQISVAVLIKMLHPGSICVCELHAWPGKYKSLLKLFLNKIDLVITNSQGTAESAIKAGVKKVEVLLNAVDINFFTNLPSKIEARKKHNIDTEVPVAVYVGHLYARKNVDVIIKTALKLPDYKFIIVGGSELELNQLKNEYEALPNNILLIGQVKHEFIGEYLAMADYLLLPNSPTNMESVLFTAPLKLFEYMASQRVVVAADLPSSRAILGNMGYYFEANNSDDLTKVLLNIDKEEARIKVQNAYQFSLNNTWTKRAEKLLTLIKKYENADNSK